MENNIEHVAGPYSAHSVVAMAVQSVQMLISMGLTYSDTEEEAKQIFLSVTNAAIAVYDRMGILNTTQSGALQHMLEEWPTIWQNALTAKQKLKEQKEREIWKDDLFKKLEVL